jgi:hypothetical protein
MPEWRRGYFRRDEPRGTQKWQSVGRWLGDQGLVGCPDCYATNHFPIGCLLGEVLVILGEGMPEWRRGYFPRDEPRQTQRWQLVGKWLGGLGPVGCPDCHAANYFTIG